MGEVSFVSSSLLRRNFWINFYFAGREEEVGTAAPHDGRRDVLVVVEGGVRNVRPADVPNVDGTVGFQPFRRNRLEHRNQTIRQRIPIG